LIKDRANGLEALASWAISETAAIVRPQTLACSSGPLAWAGSNARPPLTCESEPFACRMEGFVPR